MYGLRGNSQRFAAVFALTPKKKKKRKGGNRLAIADLLVLDTRPPTPISSDYNRSCPRFHPHFMGPPISSRGKFIISRSE